MKVAIIAPSPVPFAPGGAENIYAGLFNALNQSQAHQGELIKLPTRELGFWALIDSYYAFASLDLDHFDAVISMKYPAWMVSHPRHIVYLQHKLRGLYDTYYHTGLPAAPPLDAAPLRALWDWMGRAERAPVPRTEALLHLRLLLERLRAAGLPDHITALPGPLIRRIVHFLDGVALRADAIHAYHAISETVAARPGYFPPAAAVGVLYHPSSLPAASSPERGHVFTASRLDPAKRIDLLIDGFMRSRSRLPFLIAGEGHEATALRRRAAGDTRIRFLGFVDSARLSQLYAESAMVLFAPKDEDFGLVALEAMASGRPVITTTDAGGCTEIIEHRREGLVVAPTPAALAAAIDRLDAAPDLAARMGEAGRRRAGTITWPRLVNALLSTPAAPAVRVGRRPRIVVLSTYGAADPKGGGQLRLFHLYDRLRRVADIDLLVFDSRARTATRLVLAEGFTQTVFPAEPEYRAAEHVLNVGVDWVPISDSAFPLLAALAGSFRAACAQICALCQLVVLEQPYLSAALPDGPIPVIYDAHNMEAALKHRLYPTSVAGRRMLDLVVSTEHAACTRAAEIWACSPADAHQLSATYRIPPERFLPVPNGIDPQRIRFVPPGARAQRRWQYGTLGGDGELAYFVGSWHGPNIDAARRVIRAAAAFPDMRFVIGGGVCRALLAAGAESPDNVTLAGALDEAENLAWLTTCDIALNPMQDGSGSNLKMFEYCAAGAPVATTAIGMRATDLRDETHVRQAPFETFEDAIIATRADSLAVREQRSRAARRHVVRHFDWDVIVARLLRDSRMLAGLLAQPPAGRRRRA